jgi:hypothetical protein
MESRLIFRPHLLASDGVTRDIRRREVVVTLSLWTRLEMEQISISPLNRNSRPEREVSFRDNFSEEPSKKSL